MYDNQTRIDAFKKLYWEKIKKEKDIYLFKSNWFDCLIYRVRGHLNWYVWIPKDHLLYEKWYGERVCDDDRKKYTEDYLKVQDALASISVHWGLTYAWHQHFIIAEGYDFDYVIGFDTAHSGDAHYDGESKFIFFMEWDVYRDASYVETELEGLTKQLSLLK